MKNNRFVRVAAVAAVLILPIIAAGCLSTDQKLANKGFAAIEQGQYPAAEKALTDALKANPNNAYALLNLGTVYQRTGRFDQAREMFEKVIALNPTQTPAKRSAFVAENKTLKEIAEDNLKTLPAKK
jgi:Flp pilus assembly protein TadD